MEITTGGQFGEVVVLHIGTAQPVTEGNYSED
jgi:hypothetical protein